MQQLSASVAKLSFFRSEGLPDAIAIATGFFFRHASRLYLITNWHNVTGVNAITGQAISELGTLPDRMSVSCKIKTPYKGEDVLIARHFDMPLYIDGRPIWYEHSKRQEIDVIAIEIDTSRFEGFANLAVNDADQEERLSLAAGLDCYVLGFPEGLIGPVETPVWKRGSLAIEDHPTSLHGLIDSATRTGMSGSPVIARHSGIFAPGGFSEDSIIGTVEKFIGIYSGRVGDDALGFQLGKYWKKEVLEDILSLNTPGFHPILHT